MKTICLVSEAKMLSKYFTLSVLITYLLNTIALVYTEDDNPPGFMSIDCGLPEGSDYKANQTGLLYKSDANMIDSGESKSLLPSVLGGDLMTEPYLSNLRSFPQGKKNCYTIRATPGKGNKYLIRASFMYGNCDSLNQLPAFDLNLGADIWSKIVFMDGSQGVRKEIIHVLSSDYVHICLINTGSGTPFISAIELRLLNSSMYPTDSGSLQTVSRVNCDTETNTTVIRYKDDIYDRRWRAVTEWSNTAVSSTSLEVSNRNDYLVPTDALRTAIRPDNIDGSLQLSWDTNNASDEFYMYMHFAEVEQLQVPNTGYGGGGSEFREFNIYVNGKLWSDKPVVPVYLGVTSYYSRVPVTGSTRYIVSLNKTGRSTLPPIINAYEVYKAKQFANSGTNEMDVAAMLSIKATYGLIKDWQGDPCEPEAFRWAGLQCSYNSSDHSARIISLNLSTSGLTGEIVPSIANLTKLVTLDLSRNNLSGHIPVFLSQLPSLRVLNLKGNNFTGPVPSQLLENQEKGILTFSFDVNTTIDNKSNMSTPTIAGALVGLVLLLAALVLFGIWILRGRATQVFKQSSKKPEVNISSIERKDRRFTYSQILDITKNLQEKLGEGGFGQVYRGSVGNTQVAVKMLSASSDQGYKEFQAEVSVLMKIYHKNLTSLVGYCDEGMHIGIVYEYMANGSLDEYLSGKSFGISSWDIRLQIAIDAAQGLEYLHHGCKPAIIHRDIKASNILFNEQFQAKLADFGLSKAFPDKGGTHVSTVHVAGTHGYIDPDYEKSKRLTEKSDVYSFGVLLLVMITGQPPISTSVDMTHISEWVKFNVQNGDINQVVDPRFGGKYDVNSVWKAVELALACTSLISSKRPTMNIVVIDLKECLAIEFGRHDADSDILNEMLSTDPERALVPRPR